MAVSRLHQPNSALRLCRLGFSVARSRFCSAVCSDKDRNNQPQLKEEAGAEGTKIISLEDTLYETVEMELSLPKAASRRNVMTRFGEPQKSKRLSELFTEFENEKSENGGGLLDYLGRLERDESPSQFNDCQKGLDVEHSSTNSVKDQAATDRPQSAKSLVECLKLQSVASNTTKECSSAADTSTVEDTETSKSGFNAVGLNELKTGLKVSPTSNKYQKKRQRKNSQFNNCQKGLDVEHSSSNSVKDQAATDRPQSAKSLVECTKLQSIASNTTKECSSTADTSTVEDTETSKSGFNAVGLNELKKGLKVSPTSNKDQKQRQRKNSQFNDCQKGLDVEHSSTNSVKDQAATDRPQSAKSLVECTKLQSVASNTTKECSSSAADTSTVEDTETSKSGFNAVGLNELKEGLKVSPTSNKDQKQIQIKNSVRTESVGHKVLIRFLNSSVNESQIFEYFSRCGEILKIEFSDPQGLRFKTCCIDFKTTEGLEKAIGRSAAMFFGPITVESATSTTRIPVPSLLGDPDIPPALVKNPTRTIRIEQLSEEMRSHHILEALAFSESTVSGYFLGSSHSIAYVEFETDIGKERALAKHSIKVLGRHLVMLRVDCPRTTSVRITSTGFLGTKDVMSVCKSLGDISQSNMRAFNVLDVHYKLAEWPNMLKILNKLNGCIVEGRRLQAAPAPIFPPEVLLALWRHPEERKHLKVTAMALLRKLDSTLATSELAFLENELFSTRGLHAE